jgi:hypothetical protein
MKEAKSKRRTMNINEESQEKGIMDDLESQLASGSAFGRQRRRKGGGGAASAATHSPVDDEAEA